MTTTTVGSTVLPSKYQRTPPTQKKPSPAATRRVSRIPKLISKIPSSVTTSRSPTIAVKPAVARDTNNPHISSQRTPPNTRRTTTTAIKSGAIAKPLQQRQGINSPLSYTTEAPALMTRVKPMTSSSTAIANKTKTERKLKVNSQNDAQLTRNVPSIKNKEADSSTRQQNEPPLLAESVFDENSIICNPDALFSALCSDIDNWKMLGRYLLIPDEEIERIASKKRHTALAQLNLWCRRTLKCGSEIRYKTLSDALCNSRNSSLIHRLKDHHCNTPLYNMTPPCPAATATDPPPYIVDMNGLPITVLLDSIKPIIDNNMSNGYTHVNVHLEFHK